MRRLLQRLLKSMVCFFSEGNGVQSQIFSRFLSGKVVEGVWIKLS
jgi:hypothetical protein